MPDVTHLQFLVLTILLDGEKTGRPVREKLAWTMLQTVRNEALKYRNEAFAIHHLITDCPPFTVVRELLKNARKTPPYFNHQAG
jgi:hypothetical protein